MKKKFVKKYLNFLKIKKFYSMKYYKCEICGKKDTTIIKKKIHWHGKKFGILPVHCCNNCGFVFQNPRFNKKFYLDYYKSLYGEIIHQKKTEANKALKPPNEYLKDQKKRGQLLFEFLKKFNLKKGTVLDVGCGTGMMLTPFLKNGWKCSGNDPIKSYIEYGRNKLDLPVEWLQSEDMRLKKNSIDLVIIMGSLEHVYDINLVMKKLEKAIKKNGILVLEARGDPLGSTKDFFNQNHHRYFFGNTMELVMRKYGWEPLLTTRYPVTGPTRPNTQFCIGRYKGQSIKKGFQNLIKNGKKETALDIIYKLKYHDHIAKKYNRKIKSKEFLLWASHPSNKN
jgi:2-polyprenyl-3-methyl-5-hydroxy-6-metoxy-1,4-benzoquinol methylase